MQQVANAAILNKPAANSPPDLKAPATPMLSVNGLPPELLAQLLDRADLKGKVEIGLINGSTNVVLCGEPASLAMLQEKLQKPQTLDPAARSAIPFYKRRPLVSA